MAIRRITIKIILTAFISLLAISASAEKILNKNDAEHIFTLNREGWESYVKQITVPDGWKGKTLPLETGTSIIAFDSSNGYGLSIQPTYFDTQKPPFTLTVGSYYPPGVLPTVDTAYLNNVKKATEQDLGPSYIVNVRESLPPLIGIEITVMKK